MYSSAPYWNTAMRTAIATSGGLSAMIASMRAMPVNVPRMRWTPRATRCRVEWPARGTTAATIAQ